MELKNLKIGEVYYKANGTADLQNDYLFKHNDRNNSCFIRIQNPYNLTKYSTNGTFSIITNIRLATPEEKHWLNECIRSNKYLDKEVAMLTYKPKYVKCVHTFKGNTAWKLNQVYKTVPENSNEFPEKLKIIDKTGIERNVIRWNDIIDNSINTFISVTKEEYDAQFIVEDTFVLPEKWALKLTAESLDYINSYRTNHGKSWMRPILITLNWEYLGILKNGAGYRFEVPNNCAEITLEQFRKYVLKETIVQEPEFILPEKWCIKRTPATEVVINNYMKNIGKNSYLTTGNSKFPYVFNKERSTHHSIWEGFTEITYEQFLKYVVKEELVQPAADASIEEILEYCKKKYPEGTKIKSGSNHSNNTIYTVQYPLNRSFTPSIKAIRDSVASNCWIYYQGKYAEIVELPEKDIKTVTAQVDSKLYTLDEIKTKLLLEYDKEDTKSILDAIRKITK